jgi:hypothetical protein
LHLSSSIISPSMPLFSSIICLPPQPQLDASLATEKKKN